MNLTPEYIKDYLDSKFPGQGREAGDEYLLPSFLVTDYKRHFSINLYSGLWQDFKSGEHGNMVQLVALVEGISHKRAEMKLNLDTLLIEPRSTEYKNFKQELKIQEEEHEFLPLGVNSYDPDDPHLCRAWNFIYNRKLFDIENAPDDQYYYCVKGRYANRLIIPFKKGSGRMVYFQGRSLNDSQPKYLNPSGRHGIKTSDILYPFDRTKKYVVVCEGPLDAVCLHLHNINATCTLGSNISEVQMSILKDFGGAIVAGYDNDKAGRKGVLQMDNLRKRKCMLPIFQVHPLPQYKDWNEMHVSDYDLLNEEYILSNSEKMDDIAMLCSYVQSELGRHEGLV